MSAMEKESACVSVQLSEASEWLVRLQAEDVTEADVAAWLKWCATENANLEAFEGVQSLYDQLQALSPADRKDLLSPCVETTYARLPNGFQRMLSWGREHTLSMVAGAAAASVAVFLVSAVLRESPTLIETHDYRAPKGTQHSLLLSDRSEVTLASASELSSSFTTTTRNIDLQQGEAYFEVQHDQKRPFVVRAGAMTVTAVGTKFNVRTSGNRTVVAVTEGAVDVTADAFLHDSASGSRSMDRTGEPVTSPVRLRAGQQGALDAGHAGLVVVDIKTTAASGWRQGRLEYVLEPLSSVVDNVNRYTSRHIVIEDAAIGEMTFTGTIFIDQVDDWAMTLQKAFPIVASAAADGTLRLKLNAKNTQLDFR